MFRVKSDPKNKKTMAELDKLPETLQEIADETREDVADAIFFVAQKTVSVDESELLKSGYVNHERHRSIIGYTASHAPYVHEGTGTHIGKPKYPITPKRGRALRFEWKPTKKGRREAAGRGKRKQPNIFYFKKVMHPGIKGTRWLVKAVVKVLPKWDKFYRKNFERKMQEMRG